ncbi:hypothetical protein OKW38_005373 [Paraburkholderia sp. MM5496-R1]
MPTTIKALLAPRESDIGNLIVRRVLPARAARLIGPFIFFDHMGPAVLPAGSGVSGSREKIVAARQAWAARTFGKVPGEEHEWTPQPERGAH